MTIEFIIPTFDRGAELESMLYSLLAQKDGDWKAHVIIDTPNEFPADGIIDAIGDKRIRKTHMNRRYNDWGHSLREYGKQMSDSEYLLMTNDDNYYTPNLISEIKKAAIDNPGIIYWDMVHSHYNYSYFRCSPNFNQIDMGAFATRTDLAKQITMGTKFAADGLFIEDFKKTFPNEKITRIDKVLFVHN